MTTRAVIYPVAKEQAEFVRGLKAAQQGLPLPALREILEYYEVTASQVFEVVKFLSLHKYLLPVLTEAIPHIERIFGDCRAYLEVELDPDEGFEEIFAVIVVKAKPQGALALLSRFDSEWFTNASRRTRNRLNFTVDPAEDDSI